MVIFHSYVKLPEGNHHIRGSEWPDLGGMPPCRSLQWDTPTLRQTGQSQCVPNVFYPVLYHSYGHLSVISTYNPIYRMYNPIYNQL